MSSPDRFTPSREVYHRIRWDPRLDAREFVIGYDSHGEELEEMPFAAFVPDGEIPWHRVWYFRRGHEVVWDRRKRIDLLATRVPAEAPAPEAPPEPARTPRPVPTPEPGRVLTVPPVHQAAVVLIPPEELWGPIEALRSQHDRSYLRWMPHVTLLYPFVPEESFAEAEPLIAEALRSLEPFEVTLSGFEHFEHHSSVTAWLRPEDRPPGALKALQAALEAALPQCNEQGRRSERGFTPHLSVGQLPRSSAADLRRTLADWERDWRPLTFEVREVCLISRRGDAPFEVRRRVALGGGRRPGPGGGTAPRVLL